MKHLQLKRFTGLLLALIMLLGMVPVSAAPAAADTYVSNVITPIPMDEPEPEEESDPFADLETEEDFLDTGSVAEIFNGLGETKDTKTR